MLKKVAQLKLKLKILTQQNLLSRRKEKEITLEKSLLKKMELLMLKVKDLIRKTQVKMFPKIQKQILKKETMTKNLKAKTQKELLKSKEKQPLQKLQKRSQ